MNLDLYRLARSLVEGRGRRMQGGHVAQRADGSFGACIVLEADVCSGRGTTEEDAIRDALSDRNRLKMP